MEAIIYYVTIGILVYFLIMGGWYGLILLCALPDAIESYQEANYANIYKILEKTNFLSISILIPAFNEKSRIFNAIYSILQSDYKRTQIIVINDGSTDDTLDILIKEFDLYEIPPIVHQVIETQPIKRLYKSRKYTNITVIDKVHGPAGNGADANNCGLNASASPVYLTVDSDTVLEPEALTRILFRFLSKKHCLTVGGAIYVLNGNKVEHGRLLTNVISKKLILAFQSIEYVRSFTYGRGGLNIFAGALCNSGAFTLNEAYIVKEAGGYDSWNYAYDVELTMKLHDLTRTRKYPTKIFFDANAISWTIVPETLKSYWSQRNRWQRGMLKCVMEYKRIFLNPKFGATGMIVFPAYVLFDLMGPVIEFISYFILVLTIFLKLFSLYHFLLFIFFAWGYLVIMTLGAFYINLNTYKKYSKFTTIHMIIITTLTLFGYRQMNAACCFFATIQYFVNRLMGKNL